MSLWDPANNEKQNGTLMLMLLTRLESSLLDVMRRTKHDEAGLEAGVELAQ